MNQGTCCIVPHDNTAVLTGAHKHWRQTRLQDTSYAIPLTHGLLLPVPSFSAPTLTDDGLRPQGMDTVQKAQSNHSLGSSPVGNLLPHYESKCRWTQFKRSPAKLLDGKATQGDFKRSFAERERGEPQVVMAISFPARILIRAHHVSVFLLYQSVKWKPQDNKAQSPEIMTKYNIQNHLERN